ncbi:MAG: ATP-binding protein [Sulfurovum sp.]
MLKKVEITNFKNFNEKFTFDLSDTGDFDFNQECIKNGIVNTGIIYGENGCGKSNLGFAIFDMVSHITDNDFIKEKYMNYLNADSKEGKASFIFTFVFDEVEVIYEYTKKDYQTLVSEKLTIDNKIVIDIDREVSTQFKVDFTGAEHLQNDVGNSNISIINYVANNTILKDNLTNKIFETFRVFINNMLLYKSLDETFYIGYDNSYFKLEEDIINRGNLKNLEEFLNLSGVKCKLKSISFNGENRIFIIFNNKEILFWEIASSGTKALIIFYFWYQRLRDDKDISFLFIDEFDAFYHQDVSESIVEKLKEITDTQIILTTHNTSNISNELLRPDCYFLMESDKIISLNHRTDKELREVHNIEKMYRAGSFG